MSTTPPDDGPEIVCLGLNPALDVTYRIDSMVRGEAQRVREVTDRAGGKATNVARVAQQLGGRSHLVAALGGPNGEEFAADLAAASGLRWSAVATTRHTRRTVTVVEADGTTTAFNEAGDPMPPQEWDDVCARLATVLDAVTPDSVLVLSGSLPPDCPPEAYAECVTLAAARSVRAIVDCAGAPLLAALDAGAALVKPNRHELLATVGADGEAGVMALRASAPGAIVVASDGPGGLLCAGPEGLWRARPERSLTGNPTGAGDALVAALAVGLSRDESLPQILRAGIGSSGAAVLDPIAGHIDPEIAQELADQASVERVA